MVDGEQHRREAYRLRPAVPGQRRPADPAGPPAQLPPTTATTEPAGKSAAAAGSPTAPIEPAGESAATEPASMVEVPPTGAAATAATRSRRRVRFAHAVRRVPPGRAAILAGRQVRSWSRRPAGRVAVPATLLLIVVAATGAAGALVVPTALRSPRPVAADSPAPVATSAPADATTVPVIPAPTGPLPTTGAAVPPPGATGAPPAAHPAEALAGWARQTSAKVQVPVTALQAYGYAELVLGRTKPACGLTWTTLAAIGKVESDHGSANGSRLQPDGRVQPPIIGLPLDGQGGRQRIADTDGGTLDGDKQFDRALGPMQFIPSTWRTSGVDADNDGQADPQDLNDAALAAANYLCAQGRNLSIVEDWWAAILSYNEVQPYARQVYDAANQYGSASRA
ncbi:lytic murein transglycosylase [Plantactinospora siamensis]|uniref:Lytic murein transglycosylase n=1 Tax=Plantactinospora siamensis TaxID=555372 RepID=A0ABV6P5N7_9ACTN